MHDITFVVGILSYTCDITWQFCWTSVFVGCERNNRVEIRLRQWRRVLNNLGPYGVVWTPYEDEDFSDMLPEHFFESGIKWIGLLGRWVVSSISPEARSQRQTRLVPIHGAFDLSPSRRYLQWYFQWAHLSLVGAGDQLDHAAGVVPDDLHDEVPDTPDLPQPDGDDIGVERGGRRGGRKGRRGHVDDDGSPPRASPPRARVHEYPLDVADEASPPAIITQHSYVTMDDVGGPSHAQHAEPLADAGQPCAEQPRVEQHDADEQRHGRRERRSPPCSTGGCLEPPAPRCRG
ncbi:hypothetical protein PIB30_068829 [Stylosanthes scabra]|uniref:Aminotransferase-like plant mobile domain-containing protein n=1 Tax=Stylosanthes scabra TaxID=79078 RepID=A0ABU6ULX9_9FABA|nr:hypothetical protein [Stylosanthes scabra]